MSAILAAFPSRSPTVAFTWPRPRRRSEFSWVTQESMQAERSPTTAIDASERTPTRRSLTRLARRGVRVLALACALGAGAAGTAGAQAPEVGARTQGRQRPRRR